MYNLSEDLIFSCLDFQSQNSDLQPPNAQAEAAQIPAFHEKPLAHLAEDFSVQKAKVQILDPTSHLFHESFSDPTDLNLQVRGLQVQKGNAPREIRQIFCSPSTIAERIQCLKGQPYQTQNMGKHLRSITASFLATLGQASILTFDEVIALNIFQLSNGSFVDFATLFEVGSMRERCQAFFSSKDYMALIMTLTKMSFHSRLIMIKYGEKLRNLAYRKTSSWKMEEN